MSETSETKESPKVNINDGALQNVMTGLGTVADKSEGITATAAVFSVNEDQLANLYAGYRLASGVCDMVPEAALESDISITNDTDGSTFKALSALGLFEEVIQAGAWARAFGGGLIITKYEGKNEISKPPADSEKVTGYQVFSSAAVEMNDDDLKAADEVSLAEDPEVIRIMNRSGEYIEVHKSRITVIKGITCPDHRTNDAKLRFFGISFLHQVEKEIKAIGASISGVSHMLQENGIKVFGFKGISDILSHPDGEAKLRERITLTKANISAFNATYGDADDGFDLVSHTFTGIPDTLKVVMMFVSAITGIPVSILFGQTATGLSQTNEGDIKAYRSLVGRWRSKFLYRPMCKMISDYNRRNLGKKEDCEFEWGDIMPASNTEKLEQLKLWTESVEKLWNMDALNPIEIRKMLVNGFDPNISIEADE